MCSRRAAFACRLVICDDETAGRRRKKKVERRSEAWRTPRFFSLSRAGVLPRAATLEQRYGRLFNEGHALCRVPLLLTSIRLFTADVFTADVFTANLHRESLHRKRLSLRTSSPRTPHFCRLASIPVSATLLASLDLPCLLQTTTAACPLGCRLLGLHTRHSTNTCLSLPVYEKPVYEHPGPTLRPVSETRRPTRFRSVPYNFPFQGEGRRQPLAWTDRLCWKEALPTTGLHANRPCPRHRTRTA